MPTSRFSHLTGCFFVLVLGHAARLIAADPGSTSFAVHPRAKELLEKHCFDCHGNGQSEGNLPLDKLLAKPNSVGDKLKWIAVWQNLRAQTMPPSDQKQPTDNERRGLVTWLERDVLKLDPNQPDPGRVTIRRVNREEYENTIRDLIGVEFETSGAFPADDTGYGFDTIGDVLSLSPIHLEKYLEAAKTIVGKAIPPNGPQVPLQSISPDRFLAADGKETVRSIPFSKSASYANETYVNSAGPYQLSIDLRVTGSDEATENTASLALIVNGKTLRTRELGWDFNNSNPLVGEVLLVKGKNTITLELTPKEPPDKGEKPLFLNVRRVELKGPTDGSQNVYPAEYRRVFIDGPATGDAVARAAYARKIVKMFADRAFRRPVDEPTFERLVSLAGAIEKAAGKSPNAFEQGISQALIAILASPRFLFRAETQPEPNNAGKVVTLDEFALASRLSYFLWSSMPDDELFALAREGKLRASLKPQIDRMLASSKSDRFVENFVGQWLRTRDVETMKTDARRVLNLASNEEAFKIFPTKLRQAMRRETEMMFAHLLRENGRATELLDANYSFLNESLAKWYGIDGVKGDKLQKVSLPEKSQRGGLLTQASFLMVTSNPIRTSPVKRGLFVLDNILGTPAPPPPANVPPLEDALKGQKKKLSMKELMELHRKDALCASCHTRMDPLGLAMEHFNALGAWREKDNDQTIETAGQLITGEKFSDARELGRVIATQRRGDFHRCLAEKMLTYAIGRGVEYYDAPAIDRIVRLVEQDEGKLKMFVYGVVTSAPFQMRRGDR